MAFFGMDEEEKDRKRNDEILKALTGGMVEGAEGLVDFGKALVTRPGDVVKAGTAMTKQHLADPGSLWESIKQSVSTPEKAAYTAGQIATPGPDLAPLAKAVLLSPLMTRRLEKADPGKILYKFDRDDHSVDVTSEDGTVIATTMLDEKKRKGWSEISDKEAVLNTRLVDYLKNTPTNVAAGQFHEVKLKDLLHFPTLYKADPKLADMRVVFDTTRGAEIKGAVRTAADGTDELVLAQYPKTAADQKELLETILHEGPGHASAQKDMPPGFFGTNPQAAGGRLNYHRDMGEIDARLNQYRADWTNMDKKMVKWEDHVAAEKNAIEAAANFSDRMGFTRKEKDWETNYNWARHALGELREPGTVIRYAKPASAREMERKMEKAYFMEMKRLPPNPRKKEDADLWDEVKRLDEKIQAEKKKAIRYEDK